MKFYLILTHFDLSNHLCLVAATLGQAAIEFLVKVYNHLLFKALLLPRAQNRSVRLFHGHLKKKARLFFSE